MTSMRSFALTPGRIIVLIFVFLLSALTAVIIHLPAAWVWSQVKSELQLPPEIAIEAMGGTVWSGAALLEVRIPGTRPRALRLSWHLSFPSLADSAWPVEWRLESQQSWVEGSVVLLGTDAAELRVDNGSVALAEFAQVARQNGLTLPGSIVLSNVEIELKGQQLIDAEGRGFWDGGTVTWQVGNQSGQAQLPPFVAEMQEQGGGIALDIRTEAGREKLVDLVATPAGVVTMEVYRRLLQLSGMQSGAGGPEDTVFKVQHRLLQ